MKIAIVGAGGFIGEAFHDFFKAKGYDLVCYYKSHIPYRREEQGVVKVGSLKHEPIDVQHMLGCSHVLYLIGGDYKVKRSYQEQELLYAAPFRRFLNDLSVHNALAPKVVLFSSAGTIYGSQPRRVDETSQVDPFGTYGKIKHALEQILLESVSKERPRGLILRVTNPYGIGQMSRPGHGIIASMLSSALNGSSIGLPLDLDVYRDYIYINDLIFVVDRLLAENADGIYNVGSGVVSSLNDVLSTVKMLFPGLEYSLGQYAKPGVVYNLVDIKKLLTVIGEYDFTSIEKGLERMLNNYKKE